MPTKVDKCVKKLIKEGKSKDQAYAICVSTIKPKKEK